MRLLYYVIVDFGVNNFFLTHQSLFLCHILLHCSIIQPQTYMSCFCKISQHSQEVNVNTPDNDSKATSHINTSCAATITALLCSWDNKRQSVNSNGGMELLSLSSFASHT